VTLTEVILGLLFWPVWFVTAPLFMLFGMKVLKALLH
jgi:hypothetical protein